MVMCQACHVFVDGGARYIYVLIPKADRRKDWEDKSTVGYYIGYSKTKVGYRALLGDTVVTSAHVLFDKFIPERSADCLREVDGAKVNCDPEERLVIDFDCWLVGQHHIYIWMVNSSIRPLGLL